VNDVNDVRCEEFRELVSAFVDERLDGGELLRLEAHVRDCAGCRAFEGDVRRLRGLLRAAEAFRPLRRPPPGFAAMIAARVERPPRAQAIPFPEVRAGRRGSRVPWAGLVAAAAVAALFFAWSWQRLLPVNGPEQRIVSSTAAPTVEVASVDGGSMDTWMREHAMLARGGTLLGSAEEFASATLHSGAVPER
jgi:predicted anti-sigma-YlaC factor YlaD